MLPNGQAPNSNLAARLQAGLAVRAERVQAAGREWDEAEKPAKITGQQLKVLGAEPQPVRQLHNTTSGVNPVAARQLPGRTIGDWVPRIREQPVAPVRRKVTNNVMLIAITREGVVNGSAVEYLEIGLLVGGRFYRVLGNTLDLYSWRGVGTVTPLISSDIENPPGTTTFTTALDGDDIVWSIELPRPAPPGLTSRSVESDFTIPLFAERHNGVSLSVTGADPAGGFRFRFFDLLDDTYRLEARAGQGTANTAQVFSSLDVTNQPVFRTEGQINFLSTDPSITGSFRMTNPEFLPRTIDDGWTYIDSQGWIAWVYVSDKEQIAAGHIEFVQQAFLGFAGRGKFATQAKAYLKRIYADGSIVYLSGVSAALAVVVAADPLVDPDAADFRANTKSPLLAWDGWQPSGDSCTDAYIEDKYVNLVGQTRFTYDPAIADDNDFRALVRGALTTTGATFTYYSGSAVSGELECTEGALGSVGSVTVGTVLSDESPADISIRSFSVFI